MSNPSSVYEDDDLLDDELDTGYLDTSAMGTKIWLVKVPNFVAEKWEQIKQPNQEMGRVRIYNKPIKKDDQEVSISLVLPESVTDIPREYTMQVINNQVNNMLVFSEANHEKANNISGTIFHECTVNPVYNSEYRRIMRTRADKSDAASRRSVQFVSDINQRGPGHAGNAQFERLVELRKKQKISADDRTTRMPREELMDVLFDAFEKYTYWSFRGIVEYTKQPATYLKEVLNEICILNKRGPYNSMYQLKPEYKREKEEDKQEKSKNTVDGNDDKMEVDNKKNDNSLDDSHHSDEFDEFDFEEV